MIYGEKGVKWRLRILFKDQTPQQTIHSYSRAKANRIARHYLDKPNVKAVELAEIRKVERITPVAWYDANHPPTKDN